MRISNLFPSNYLRAADLQGNDARVRISRVTLENLADEKKPVVYFDGKQKGLILNKTNANTIAQRYGDDTEDWKAVELILYSTSVDVRGERRDAIRIKIPPRSDSQAPVSEVNPPPNMGEGLNDPAPF